jgi:hypothetical protein
MAGSPKPQPVCRLARVLFDCLADEPLVAMPDAALSAGAGRKATTLRLRLATGYLASHACAGLPAGSVEAVPAAARRLLEQEEAPPAFDESSWLPHLSLWSLAEAQALCDGTALRALAAACDQLEAHRVTCADCAARP